MHLTSTSLVDGQPIDARHAFGKPGNPVALSDNVSPQLAWSGAPAGTASFVVTCIDGDAPSRDDDVNQAGRTVPADLPRVEFTHWLLANVPVGCTTLAEGACGEGIIARGKREPKGPRGSVQGRNDYTGWFAGDAAMAGEYRGYDGPCPPWNDSIAHRYRFAVLALDVEHLDLAPGFTLAELRAALAGHVLAEASLTGTYTLNPTLAR